MRQRQEAIQWGNLCQLNLDWTSVMTCIQLGFLVDWRIYDPAGHRKVYSVDRTITITIKEWNIGK